MTSSSPDLRRNPVLARCRKWLISPGVGPLASVLIAFVGVVYGCFLRNPLVFDDYVIFESLVQDHADLLSHFTLRWFPYASLDLTWRLVGVDLFWLHLGNLLLHAANAVLLFVLLRALFTVSLQAVEPPAGALSLTWWAFFAALIFALHPVAVYGTAYLVQRSILMATLFSLLSWGAYFRGLVQHKPGWFVAAVVFYFAAVFSKEHSIMAPGIALAGTFLLRQPSRALLRQIWWPFLLFALVGLGVVLKSRNLLWSAYEPAAMAMLAQLSESRGAIDMAYAYPLSVLTQTALFFKYLALWIVPFPGWMSIDMREPFATSLVAWPQLLGGLGFVLYGVAGLKLLLARGRLGLLGLALLFPWILFATELVSVRIQEPFVLYRSYLWMGGLFASLPVLLGRLPARLAFAVMLTISVLLMPLSWNRLQTFSAPFLLWDDAEALVRDKTPTTNPYRIYYNRGNAYGKAGLRPQAISDYSKAIQLNPGVAAMHNNRGFTYLELGQHAQALHDFDQAIALNQNHAKAYIGRAFVYESYQSPDAALENFRISCALGLPAACAKAQDLSAR